MTRRLSCLLAMALGLGMSQSGCDAQAPAVGAQGAAEPVPATLTQALSGPAPELTLVSPRIGPMTGGIPITLTGKNFRPGAVVSFGGVPSGLVKLVSSTQLTAYLPASPGAFGRVPVTISQPDGKSVTRSDVFYYYGDSVAWGPAFHYADGLMVKNFVLRDVNGDGKPDVVATDHAHDTVAVLLGKGDGSVAAPITTSVVAAPDSLVMADA